MTTETKMSTTLKQVSVRGVRRWVTQPDKQKTPEPVYLSMRDALGKTLRSERTKAGMTLRDLSKVGVSLGYISEIERGTKEVSAGVLDVLCKGLGVPLSDVLRDTADLMETPQ